MKTPYPYQLDAINKIRDAIDDGKTEIAFITVRQAIGRAVRGPQDSAEVYFLDTRFKSLFPRLGLMPNEEVCI